MKGKLINISVNALYFAITIMLLSSLGVWLPFAFDKAQYDCIQESTWNGLPWNLITYSIALVMVAFIDRIRYLFKTNNEFNKNELEFFIILVIIILAAFLIYKSLVDSKFSRLDQSIIYAWAFTALSWIVWLYVKHKNPSYDNYSTLGGRF
ncbi:hypothetical protein [Pontibacter indicus]|uniref:Uncharacterized protein n=1 Tax=Pontibacter indicus TaxID=1317125 RepID=A0A1R3WVA2_9BACT|nr:hypothetical protein [Pontibacter indicus]SIT81974.1 hypothetical protein SAMN05444128_1047 [Pontibacter indicus]